MHLVCACLKKVPTRTLLEKATEVNVSRISFIKTANTDGANVRLVGKWLDDGKARDVVREGSEQCGRLDVPGVDGDVSDLKTLLDNAKLNGTKVAVCRERSPSSVPLLEYAAALLASSPSMIVVGPEGGWSPAEVEWFESEANAIQSVSLGNNVLRAETAAILAAGVLGNLRT